MGEQFHIKNWYLLPLALAMCVCVYTGFEHIHPLSMHIMRNDQNVIEVKCEWHREKVSEQEGTGKIYVPKGKTREFVDRNSCSKRVRVHVCCI